MINIEKEIENKLEGIPELRVTSTFGPQVDYRASHLDSTVESPNKSVLIKTKVRDSESGNHQSIITEKITVEESVIEEMIAFENLNQMMDGEVTGSQAID